MATAQSFSIWLLQVFLLSGLLVFFLWLSLHPSKPTYTIIDFSISGDGSNTSFTVEIANNNKGGGIYYSGMNVTLYIEEVNAGNTMLPSFYQRHERTTLMVGSAKINHTVHEVLNGRAALKVGLVAKVRYKIWLWRSRFHGMDMLASVPVGRDGKLKIKKAKMHARHQALRIKRKLNL
ncbi:hypothetical protein J5N97_011501 [Dioscorea zingiberensis]|uniref:Late embryogenesis abundant protein LEA-2 subgroup domain-containing protein n=1 Tax=Dioscorea zingiberensis TaxID=325984 RepID=A0A9D5D155_9LILI|nr:hypothetical protein J5N97_011415 [Dioscorea zingiberensis]KAJ0983246.1 hypothetical protein J5N97_011501 [Dioscorea zingiberensis]